MKAVLDGDNPPSESTLLQAIDSMVLNQARMKAKQGRLGEAEVDARRALLSRLKDTGKYNATMPKYVVGLASILVEQGRYSEAEQLERVALGINKTVGVAQDSPSNVALLSHLGNTLTFERKPEALEIYGRPCSRHSRLRARVLRPGTPHSPSSSARSRIFPSSSTRSSAR
jgi:Tetratricopeptide repeat